MENRTAPLADADTPSRRRSIGAKRNPATEDAILTAAQSILDEKGVRGLSMEAVAKRARAGKATLYKWWPTRGALLVAVYERSKGNFKPRDLGDLVSTVAAFYDHVFAFWKTPAGQLFPLIIAEAQSDKSVAEALETYRRERLETLIESVGWSKARGELVAEAHPERIADMIMSLAWTRLLTGHLDEDTTELAHQTMSVWLKNKE